MVDFQEELDARNESCPKPMMMTKKSLQSMASGEVLHVVATDPASLVDIDILVKSLEYEMLEQTEGDGEYHFYIKKA